MKRSEICHIALLIVLLVRVPLHAANPPEITVTAIATKPIPIALSGYSGEVAKVLDFDLSVCGFEIVAADRADFELTGKANGHVEGVLTDKTKGAIFSRQYPGGTTRAQAHALADDVVQALTGTKGLGRTKIAFKVVTGRTSEIYVSDFDGANAQAMTEDHSTCAAPAWVPGRRVLYYMSFRQNNPDIYSHDLTTGTRSAVARYTGLNSSPALSPDGTRLAMILSKSGSPDLWVANADGSNLKQLTTTTEDESSPCWSPDGRTICFASRKDGPASLYTIPAAGGEMRRLNTGGRFSVSEPDWSPDGKKIAFTQMKRGENFDLCVLEIDKGNVRVVAAGEDSSWAPNSRTLVFTRRVGGRRVLSLLDVPTGRVKDAAQVSGSCSQPSWAR
jgi:TolB protein